MAFWLAELPEGSWEHRCLHACPPAEPAGASQELCSHHLPDLTAPRRSHLWTPFTGVYFPLEDYHLVTQSCWERFNEMNLFCAFGKCAPFVKQANKRNQQVLCRLASDQFDQCALASVTPAVDSHEKQASLCGHRLLSLEAKGRGCR